MPCFHACRDDSASCPVVWAAMLTSTLGATFAWVWAALAFLALTINSPHHISTQCPGTTLWYSVLASVLFTCGLSVFLVLMVIDAQSGRPLRGQDWPMWVKRAVVSALAGLWFSLWVWSGITSLSSGTQSILKDNKLRLCNLSWFCAFPVAAGLTACGYGIKKALRSQSDRTPTVRQSNQLWTDDILNSRVIV